MKTWKLLKKQLWDGSSMQWTRGRKLENFPSLFVKILIILFPFYDNDDEFTKERESEWSQVPELFFFSMSCERGERKDIVVISVDVHQQQWKFFFSFFIEKKSHKIANFSDFFFSLPRCKNTAPSYDTQNSIQKHSITPHNI